MIGGSARQKFYRKFDYFLRIFERPHVMIGIVIRPGRPVMPASNDIGEN